MKSPTTPNIVSFTTKVLKLSLSPMQETILASAYALRPTSAHLELFEKATGLPPECWPTQPVSTLVVIAGRGSGKDSRLACPIALYEALFGPEPQAVGEQSGTVTLIAQNERAARGVALRYLKDYVRSSSLIASKVERDGITANAIRFKSGLIIETLPSTGDAPRGLNMPVAILDEVGVWRLEGRTDSDREILAAVQARADKVVIISTPLLQAGVLWDYSKRWGQPEPGLLVWRASTTDMVPSLGPRVEHRRRQMDPETRQPRV